MKLHTYQQAAERLGTTPGNLRKLKCQKAISARKIKGVGVRFTEVELQKFIDRNSIEV